MSFLFFSSCSTVLKTKTAYSKGAIINHYLDLMALRSNFVSKYSEYHFTYADTVFCYEELSDSLYLEKEYSNLSIIDLFPCTIEEQYSRLYLPPYLIEKRGVYFIPNAIEEKRGPGHDDVERILRIRGHYVAPDNGSYDWFTGSPGERTKAIYFYINRDKPQKYKLVRSNRYYKFTDPPKMKGIIVKTRIIKAGSLRDLPHYH